MINLPPLGADLFWQTNIMNPAAGDGHYRVQSQ
jgi:hypothetical protein